MADFATPVFGTDLSDPLITLRRTDSVTVNGRTSSVAYDGVARTATTTSPAGRTATTTLDTSGRPASVVAPGTEEVRYVYDSRGRVERIEQGAGATERSVEYGYDSSDGWLVSVTDSLNRTVTYERDAAGRVTKQTLPDLREIDFTYDANGNVTSVTPPTQPAHDFDYTAVDQVELYTPPDAGFTPRATSYSYNADGQVTVITRPDGQAIGFTYETNGRLDFVTLPTGTVDVGYDTAGRVATITGPGGVGHGFTYDGPFVLSTSTTGPVPGTVGFDYDADLRLASRTVNGSSSVSFGYDADGLLTSAGALSLARNAASGLLETTTLATTTDARTRTSFGEVDTWTGSVGGSAVYSYDLDRDAAGRITTKTETIGGVTSVWEYAYHPERGWLTEVKKDSVVVASYGYDDNGNRTSFDDFWGSGTSTYDVQDRQLTADLVEYAYTAHGERLTKTAGVDVTSYVYDVRGALLSVDLPNGIEIDYVVDASGRRIGKKVDDVLTQGWIYAGGLSPVAQTDGTGAITQSYVYATKGNVPDALVAGGVTYRIFTDHLGSVRLVINTSTGAIAQRIDYDAWGRITLDTNPGFQPFGFAGGLYDPQTGLTRFGSRDYDPETGRWTTKDPIGFAGGSSGLYTYVSNDPVNAIDPSGLANSRLESLQACHQVVEDTYMGILGDVIDGSGSGNIAGPISGVIVYLATKVVGGVGCEASHWDVYIRGDLETQAAFGMRMAGVASVASGGLRFGVVAPATVRSQLQVHLRRATARFEAEGLTARQAAAVARNPRLEAAYRGERIDTFFKESVAADPALQNLTITPRFRFGPDVAESSGEIWYDVTTPGDWMKHVVKYGPGGVPLYY